MPDHVSLRCRQCGATADMPLHHGTLDIHPAEGWEITTEKGVTCPSCTATPASTHCTCHGLPLPCAAQQPMYGTALTFREIAAMRAVAELPGDARFMPVERRVLRELLDGIERLDGERDRAIAVACALDEELAIDGGI